MNVYLITNLKNDMGYVGVRKKDTSDYLGSGRLINEAIEEFGKKNFVKDILFTIPGEAYDDWIDLYEIESAYIEALGTLFPKGYNLKIKMWPLPREICQKGGAKAAETNRKNCTSFFDPKVVAMGLEANKRKGTWVYSPGFQNKIREGQKRNGTGLYGLKVHVARRRLDEINRWIYKGPPWCSTLPFSEVAKRMRMVLNGEIKFPLDKMFSWKHTRKKKNDVVLK